MAILFIIAYGAIVFIGYTLYKRTKVNKNF